MDKTKSFLLAGGIAILFPVLVLFAVITVIPSKDEISTPEPPALPEAPAFPECSYDETALDAGDPAAEAAYELCLDMQTEYQRQLDEHTTKSEQYQDTLDKHEAAQENAKNKRVYNRASLAIVVSIVALAATLALLSAKELSAGLVIGATLSIIIAISYIVSAMGSTDIEMLPIALIASSFAVLTAVLYLLERTIPDTQGPKITPPPSAPKPTTATTQPPSETPPPPSTSTPA